MLVIMLKHLKLLQKYLVLFMNMLLRLIFQMKQSWQALGVKVWVSLENIATTKREMLRNGYLIIKELRLLKMKQMLFVLEHMRPALEV